MRIAGLIAILVLSQPVLAAEPMSAAEFEAYTTGKTLYYGEGGAPYGAEEYLPGRRVRWSFLDGDCKDGEWYARGPDICFVYEDSPEPQCWQFFEGPAGLTAEFVGDPDGLELYEAREGPGEMLCLGPKIGV